MYRWNRIFGALAWALLASCAPPGGRSEPAESRREPDLTPKDRRPVYSVQVGDADEAALLAQELELEMLRQEGSTLYFFDEPALRKKLGSLGYTPERADPYQVFHGVVRMERRGSEKDLATFGVRLINREDEYWIVEAPLATLRALQRSGYRLASLEPTEPRPRQVRVWLERPEDAQRVADLQVDIYSVGKERGRHVLYGGAFDCQIDRLKEEGFEVERVSSKPRGGQP